MKKVILFMSISIVMFACVASVCAQVPTGISMNLEWTWNVSEYPQFAGHDLYGVTLGAVMGDDIDGDGDYEILWAFRKAEDRIMCLNAKTKTLKWVYPSMDQDGLGGGDPWGIGSIEDIDGDGVKEILIMARNNNLYCLTPNGQLKWMYECGGSEIAPALYDVNGDGNLEIIIGPLKTAEVQLLDNTGTLIWSFGIPTYANCGCTAFDLDKDGEVEIVFPDGSGNMFCLSAMGTEEWRFEMGDKPNQLKPVIADVNNDDEYEVLVHSKDRYLYCLTFYGTELWRFPVGEDDWEANEDAGISEGGIAVADVDADGSLEVLVSDWVGNFYCVNGVTGSEKWYYKFPGEAWCGMTVGDVNGDGKVDVVVGSDGEDDTPYPMGVIVALDGASGVPVGEFPAAVASCQAMGDWDGDGQIEIAAYLEEAAGCFYMLGMDGTYDPALVPWPFRFKNLHNNPVVPIPEVCLFALPLFGLLALRRLGS